MNPSLCMSLTGQSSARRPSMGKVILAELDEEQVEGLMVVIRFEVRATGATATNHC